MDDIPQQLRNEALGWLLGDYENAELVAWADGWIERLDEWPDELTEISLEGRNRSASILPLLQSLAIGGDEIEAVAFFLEWEYAHFRGDRNPYRLSQALYPIVYSSLGDKPIYQDLITAIYRLDYWANEVIYQNEQEKADDLVMRDNINREFVREFGALPAPFTFKP